MRRTLLWIAVPAACAGVSLLSLTVGTSDISTAEVVAALVGAADRPTTHIVVGLRLPRALIAITAGAMLGVAGALLQSATRNPLVDAGLVGVTGGASLAIVGAIAVVGAGVLHPVATLGIGAVGGASAAALVAMLGWRGGTSPLRLVLSGVIVSSTLSSLVSVLLILDGELASALIRWVVGTLHGRVWVDWALLWPIAIVGLAAAMLVRRASTALWLGDDAATSIGMRVGRARIAVFSVAVLLTVGAVVAVGAIGFVGLLAPNLARWLGATHPARLVPASAAVGALLLAGSDLLSAVVSHVVNAIVAAEATSPLPAGAIMAIVGGPTLVVLMMRRDAT